MLKQQEISLLKNKLESDSKRLDIDEELGKEVFIKELGLINIKESGLLKKAKEMDNEIIYLNKLKTTLDNHLRDLKEVEMKITDDNNVLSNYNDQLNQLVGKITPLDHLKQLTESKINQMINDDEKQLQDLDALIAALEKNYHYLKEKMIQLETNDQALVKQLQEEKNNYQDKSNIYLEQLKQLFDDEDHFIELLPQIVLLNDKEKEYNDYLINKTTLQNQISELKKELENTKYVDTSKIEEKTMILKKELEGLQDSLNKQKAKLMMMKKQLKILKKLINS